MITAGYEEQLRSRQSLLRKVTKTDKSLYHTFITIYGVAHNLPIGIVQSEVAMDELIS